MSLLSVENVTAGYGDVQVLWGVDLQLDNKFDHNQWTYFTTMADHLSPDDCIILCSPIPTWAHAGAEPTSFDVLRRLVEEEIEPRGARVVLHLSGDSHHYSRYERQQLQSVRGGTRVPAPRTDGRCRVQYVTAGGGGAFTHPTHHLDDFIDLPVSYEEGATTLALQERGGTGGATPRPTSSGSHRLILRNLLLPLFLRQNLGFLLVPGSVAAMVAFAAFRRPQQLSLMLTTPTLPVFARSLLSSSMGLALILLAVGGWTAFAKPRRGGGQLVARAVGFSHGWAELAFRKPPPLVPNSLMISWLATGPPVIVCVPPTRSCTVV